MPGHSRTPGKSEMREESGKIQILRGNGSSGWFNSQDKYSAVNDSVRTGVLRPHCASMAHRPRAPARVDQRRTFGKNDSVQVKFSGASKNIDFCAKNHCVYLVWVLRVAFFLRVCPCVSVRVSDPRVWIQNAERTHGGVLNVYTGNRRRSFSR